MRCRAPGHSESAGGYSMLLHPLLDPYTSSITAKYTKTVESNVHWKPDAQQNITLTSYKLAKLQMYTTITLTSNKGLMLYPLKIRFI